MKPEQVVGAFGVLPPGEYTGPPEQAEPGQPTVAWPFGLRLDVRNR